MQLEVRVFNPAYDARIDTVARPATVGPLKPLSIGISTKLDKAGNGRATFPFSPRAFELLQVRRVCELHYFTQRLAWDEINLTFVTEQVSVNVGEFIVQDVRYNPQNHTVTVSGPTLMHQLADSTTLPGLSFEAETIESVIDSLAAKGGWLVDYPAALTDLISLPYSGGSVLRNIQRVVESQGLHLRKSDTGLRRLEVGALGDQGSRRLEYVEGDAGEMALRSDAPYLISDMELIEESSELANWLVLYGAGDGDARLTLEDSTRPGVESISRNGQTHYIVKDDTSIAEYGQIERQLTIKRVAPTGTSDAALQAASNVLYDAGKAWLDRHKDPYKVYRLTVTNAVDNIEVGNKIRLRYQGVINRQGNPYTWASINQDVWVMEVENTFSVEGGRSVRLTVATIDRYRTDASDIVVGMVESISVNNVSVKPYPTVDTSGPFRELIDSSNDVTFDEFEIRADVLRLTKAELTVYRRSFTATATGAETVTSDGGGDHRHLMFKHLGSATAAAFQEYEYSVPGSFGIASMALSAPRDLYTWESSGTHTHTIPPADLVYGINRDTDLPEDVDITVNGVSVATGEFGSGSSDTAYTIDVTDEVLGKAGGWRGTNHTVGITCGAGQGEVVAVMRLRVDIQTF